MSVKVALSVNVSMPQTCTGLNRQVYVIYLFHHIFRKCTAKSLHEDLVLFSTGSFSQAVQFWMPTSLWFIVLTTRSGEFPFA